MRAAGFSPNHLAVLDVAPSALAASRERLGEQAEAVQWLAQDLLGWNPARRYDLWHDRAVFHFLTDPGDCERYRNVLGTAPAPGGHVIIGTFAADGPEHCSGLPVARYGPDALAAEFPGWTVRHTEHEEHHPPGGGMQPFTWLVLSPLCGRCTTWPG